MDQPLATHIKRFVSLSDSDVEEICSRFTSLEIAKKQNILTTGESCKYLYFVGKGCLQLFSVDERGVEQTIQFALENWWMTDLEAFNRHGRASFCIQALEKSQLLAIDKNSFDSLLSDHPLLEKYFRLIYERAYSASLFRMKYFRLPKEEFYDNFYNSYPDFIQRIPQKVLASFLGFTPEYLSELRRKKMLSKK